jgi:hypothetical protein
MTTDDFLRELAASDPAFAAALDEQDRRFSQKNSLDEWRERMRKFREDSAAAYARAHSEDAQPPQRELDRAAIDNQIMAHIRGALKAVSKEMEVRIAAAIHEAKLDMRVEFNARSKSSRQVIRKTRKG